jgi:hypothetical protein
MVGSNKILTVSYGTFSCTLEGFDDPFSAMRSIAEYFRDLAAEDRFFGAEPPTPDPEMLHRIAEREVRRRVEARSSPEGIVLRQIGDTEAEGPGRQSEPVVPARPAAVRPTPLRSVPTESHSPARPAAESPAAESVVSKLSRIRAVVDRARTASVPAHPVSPPASVAEASLGLPEDEFIEAPPRPRAPVFAPEAPAADVVAVDVVPEPEMAAAKVAAPTAPEIAPAMAELDADPDSEDVRPWENAGEAEADAPVAQSAPIDIAEVEEDVAEDEVALDHAAEDAAPDTDDEATATVAFDDDMEASEDDAGAIAEDDPDERPSDNVQLEPAERPAPADAYEEDAEPELDEVTLAGIRMAMSAEQDAIAQERKEARMERRNVLIGGDPDREPAFDRILEETNSKMQDREGSRRRSAIAHLKAAVAATKADRLLKRERSREIDEEEQRNYREDLAKVVRPHPSEPRESAAEKARAAAAASVATPLVLGSTHRIDPVAEASAPSELRPRRVGAMIAIEDEPEFEEADIDRDESDFIAFAHESGARDLPDVLEAAAAYTAYVEGHASFSRPQIMRRAAAVETDEEFTREAGLRSFGQLLRQGKIRKLQRGQFTIAETTRFRPKARIAGE